MIQNLKPCPYCGTTPFEEIKTEIKVNWFHSYSAYFTVFIGCKRCGIEMNSGEESAKRITFDKLDEIRERMRKRWNKRTETFLTISNSDNMNSVNNDILSGRGLKPLQIHTYEHDGIDYEFDRIDLNGNDDNFCPNCGAKMMEGVYDDE